MGTENLFAAVNIPLPTKPLDLHASDSERVMISKIDAYFDDLIKGYPSQTRDALHEMYYHGTNVHAEDSLGSTGAQSNWMAVSDGTLVSYHMLMNTELSVCPLVSRWNKIHQIAGHLGQAHQRVGQVGYDGFIGEMAGGAFRKFTEQSIAPAEKYFIDKLPANHIQRDLAYVRTSKTKAAVELGIGVRKQAWLEGYIRLNHREGDKVADSLTEADHQNMMNHKGVQQFVTDFYAGDLRHEINQASRPTAFRTKTLQF